MTPRRREGHAFLHARPAAGEAQSRLWPSPAPEGPPQGGSWAGGRPGPLCARPTAGSRVAKSVPIAAAGDGEAMTGRRGARGYAVLAPWPQAGPFHPPNRKEPPLGPHTGHGILIDRHGFLGARLLVGLEPGEVLDAPEDAAGDGVGELADGAEDAVEAEGDPCLAAVHLEMDVAGAGGLGLADEGFEHLGRRAFGRRHRHAPAGRQGLVFWARWRHSPCRPHPCYTASPPTPPSRARRSSSASSPPPRSWPSISLASPTACSTR